MDKQQPDLQIRIAMVAMVLVVAILLLAIFTGCSCRSQLVIEPVEGKGFITSIDASLIARELTDEEIDNADSGKGCGFGRGRNAGEDADWMEGVGNVREA